MSKVELNSLTSKMCLQSLQTYTHAHKVDAQHCASCVDRVHLTWNFFQVPRRICTWRHIRTCTCDRYLVDFLKFFFPLYIHHRHSGFSLFLSSHQLLGARRPKPHFPMRVLSHTEGPSPAQAWLGLLQSKLCFFLIILLKRYSFSGY
jgi:hypothetical protein